jgi:hypothetical protein
VQTPEAPPAFGEVAPHGPASRSETHRARRAGSWLANTGNSKINSINVWPTQLVMVFEHQDLASNQPFQASCRSFCGPPILGIWSVQFLQMFHLNVLETAKKNSWSIHPVLARCKAVGPNVAWWESCHKRPTGHPLHKPFPCNTLGIHHTCLCARSQPHLTTLDWFWVPPDRSKLPETQFWDSQLAQLQPSNPNKRFPCTPLTINPSKSWGRLLGWKQPAKVCPKLWDLPSIMPVSSRKLRSPRLTH